MLTEDEISKQIATAVRQPNTVANEDLRHALRKAQVEALKMREPKQGPHPCRRSGGQ